MPYLAAPTNSRVRPLALSAQQIPSIAPRHAQGHRHSIIVDDVTEPHPSVSCSITLRAASEISRLIVGINRIFLHPGLVFPKTSYM